MEENNTTTPDMHHNHKRATAQKKKAPRQRKYRLAGIHKRTRIQRRWKIHASSRRSVGFYIFSHTAETYPSLKNVCVNYYPNTILRELVINDLAGNLPTYGSTKKKAKLRKSLKKRLEHLARGQYHKDYLPILFPYLQLLTIHTLQFHGICK